MAEEFVKIGGLSPKSKRVNTVFKVVSLEDIKNVRSKKDRTAHAVTEALVGDDTGVVLMTLWDESLEKIKQGGVYRLMNGYVSLFKGTIRLNIGKYGEIEEVEGTGIDVKADNNVSQRIYDENRGRRMYDGFSSGSFWP
jgi:replication factor A1